jgi:hypothetical protein
MFDPPAVDKCLLAYGGFAQDLIGNCFYKHKQEACHIVA